MPSTVRTALGQLKGLFKRYGGQVKCCFSLFLSIDWISHDRLKRFNEGKNTENEP